MPLRLSCLLLLLPLSLLVLAHTLPTANVPSRHRRSLSRDKSLHGPDSPAEDEAMPHMWTLGASGDETRQRRQAGIIRPGCGPLTADRCRHVPINTCVRACLANNQMRFVCRRRGRCIVRRTAPHH